MSEDKKPTSFTRWWNLYVKYRIWKIQRKIQLMWPWHHESPKDTIEILLFQAILDLEIKRDKEKK